MPSTPHNSTLIQVGFNYGLNYPFVVRTAGSAQQIFAYLPSGIAYGLGIDESDVTMYALQPFDTSSDLDYITTLALAYVPSSLVDQLQLDLHTPVATIYSNPDSSTNTLMSKINPAIAILPGSTVDSAQSAQTNDPSGESASASDAGAPIGGDSGNSSPVRGTSVGIGVGAAAGAAVYAAAMVFVARRYKKRRQRHQRVSSLAPTNDRTMSQVSAGMGGYFMSGARGRTSPTNTFGRGSRHSGGSSNGRSVREQGISAPVMAENSLGWN
ncbi:multicopy suppressor of a budding defect [Zalaria obscura]|uniref:Multicopy suppressor of a budding defect n=1 Tax=Zalaria obscura TaxID=2024903 RepID=A0ACC3SLN2_9PEZI